MAKVSTCLFFSLHTILPEAEFSNAASAECFHIQFVDTHDKSYSYSTAATAQHTTCMWVFEEEIH